MVGSRFDKEICPRPIGPPRPTGIADGTRDIKEPPSSSRRRADAHRASALDGSSPAPTLQKAQIPGRVSVLQCVKKASQSLLRQQQIKSKPVFCRGVYLAENTSQAASVEFVPRRGTNYARSRLPKFVGKACRGFSTVSSTDTRKGICASVCQRTPAFIWRKLGFFLKIVYEMQMEGKMEFFPLHIASFFRFMAAYLSLTHRVTAAKPLWCV